MDTMLWKIHHGKMSGFSKIQIHSNDILNNKENNKSKLKI